MSGCHSLTLAPRRLLGAVAAIAATLGALGNPLGAQPTTAIPTAALTSASAEARQSVSRGLEDAAYGFNARAGASFARAIAADPSLGVARALRAAFTPGLDAATRDSEATRGVADASRGSTTELLLAAAARELATNRDANAKPLFRALSEMYPNDPTFATWAAIVGAQGRSAAETADAMRDLTRRFPNYGAPYNVLAYSLMAIGDSSGAVYAAKRQIELAPDAPNAQDSYAEMLQWTGRLDEAAAAYNEATRLAPSFSDAFVGLAEVRQLQRRTADARIALSDALRNAQTIGDSVRYMTYLAQNAVYANDLPGATRQFAAVVQLATERKRPNIALAHANLAAVSALANNRAAVMQHAAHIAGLEGTPPIQASRTLVGAYLAAGMIDSLRAIATRNDSAYIARAAVALVDGKPVEALQSLARADSSAPLVQELSAEAHAKMGHADIARAARDRFLARRDVYYNDADLRGAIAIRRAEKMKP